MQPLKVLSTSVAILVGIWVGAFIAKGNSIRPARTAELRRCLNLALDGWPEKEMRGLCVQMYPELLEVAR